MALGPETYPFHANRVYFSDFSPYPTPVKDLLEQAQAIFQGYFPKMLPPGMTGTNSSYQLNAVHVTIDVSHPNVSVQTLDTNERYNVSITREIMNVRTK